MRIEDFHDLGLNEEELAELEQSLQLIGQAVQQEEEIPLPDSLRGCAVGRARISNLLYRVFLLVYLAPGALLPRALSAVESARDAGVPGDAARPSDGGGAGR